MQKTVNTRVVTVSSGNKKVVTTTVTTTVKPLQIEARDEQGQQQPHTVRIWRAAHKRQPPALSLRNAIARHKLVATNVTSQEEAVQLVNYSDELYTAQVTFGNGQSFAVDLDTGSSDVWIRGPNAKSTDGSTGSGKPSISLTDKSIVNTGKSFSTSYGSGAVSGEIYQGKVELGGVPAILNFGITTEERGFNSPGDGLWGLAFASINQIQGGNYVQEAGIKTLSFYFSNARDGGDEGELTINGVDSTKFSGEIQYVPISSDTYYQFNPAGGSFVVNGETIEMTGDSAISDTGTTLLLCPNEIADALNKAIGAGPFTQGIYPFTDGASVLANGPTITVNIGPATVTLSPKEYVLSNGDGSYVSGISQIGFLGGGGPAYIFGDTFLRAVYQVYDIENNRLGFAQAVHP